jgi:hypothetical protein
VKEWVSGKVGEWVSGKVGKWESGRAVRLTGSHAHRLTFLLAAALAVCTSLADGFIDVICIDDERAEATARTSSDGTNVYLSMTLPRDWTNYTVLASHDLANWWEMGAHTNASPDLIIVDRVDASPRKFFRVRRDETAAEAEAERVRIRKNLARSTGEYSEAASELKRAISDAQRERRTAR